MSSRGTARQRILKAASELAQTQGCAHLSLDAVAAQAGVSKGGLLYNFPNKTALLKALVEQFVERSSTAILEEQPDRGSGTSVAVEYFNMVVEEISRRTPPPSGILAALSENLDLLSPIRRLNRQLLDRIEAEGGDRVGCLVAFLALEGMRAQQMFGVDALSGEEKEVVLERIRQMLCDR